MTRYAKRTDANHSDIRDGLRAAGYPVLDLSACGGGVPDICVMVSTDPVRSLFIEIKDGDKVKSAQKLTTAEEAWFKFNGAVSAVANSLEAALNAVRAYEEGK